MRILETAEHNEKNITIRMTAVRKNQNDFMEKTLTGLLDIISFER